PLTGHTNWVWGVATATLPDGRVVAVTGSWDATVRVWDLTRSTPVGNPLTGHAGSVRAVATTTLPDGRVLAITSNVDATVRAWDLLAGCAWGHPLCVVNPAVAVSAVAGHPGDVVVAGPGLARLRLSRVAGGSRPGSDMEVAL